MKKDFTYFIFFNFLMLIFFAAIMVKFPYIIKEFEYKLYDFRMQFMVKVKNSNLKILKKFFLTDKKNKQKKKLAVIAIDSKSIDKLGRWPWSREIISKIMENLITYYKCKLVALDIVFSEKQKCIPGKLISRKILPDDILKNTIEKYRKKIILGYFFTSYKDLSNKYKSSSLPYDVRKSTFKMVKIKGKPLIEKVNWIESNIPLISKKSKYSGFFNIKLDSDGTARRAILMVFYRNKYICKSIPMQIYSIINNPILLEVDTDSSIILKSPEHTLTLPSDGKIYIPFDEDKNIFQVYSAYDIYKKTISPQNLENAICLIGATETGIYDLRTTPLKTNYPGIYILAQITHNLLNHTYISDFTDNIIFNIFILIFLYLSISSIYSLNINHYLKILISFFIIFFILIFNLWQFCHYKWFNLFTLIIFFLNLFITYEIWEVHFAQKDLKKIKKILSHYVSPIIMREIIENKVKLSLYGEEKEITLLFSDIRSFTTISENINPIILTKALNEYFTPLTDIIFQNKGTLDKYMGDCIMCFWGAPLSLKDKEYLAVKSAIEMKNYLKNIINPSFEKKNYPVLKANYGIATGKAIVGNMGSKKIFDYTAIGDKVNLAARLEGLNKKYGTQILVCEKTYEKIKNAFITRFVDKVVVKGKSKPISIYEIIDFIQYEKKYHKKLDLYNKGIQYFLEKDLKKAKEIFEELKNLYPDDKLSIFYLSRIDKILKGDIAYKDYTTWDEK